jgi:mono/diheme cytochrome c family protein/YHS domain-containing protein
MKKSIILSLSVLLSGALFAEDPKSPEEANIYKDVLQPVLDAKCVDCHGPIKRKGGLRLENAKELFKGGKGAKEDIVIKGENADDSELYYRMNLPKDDDDVMPPFESPDTFNPVTKEELAIFKWWIEDGASLDKTVAQAPASVRPHMEKILKDPPKAKKAPRAPMNVIVLPELPKPSADAIKKVEATGALFLPIHQTTNAYTVNALPVQKEFGDKHVSELASSIAEQTLWLNLSKTQITDAGITNLTKFKELRRLYLDNTKITDKALATISKLSNLEYLNLYGTEVTDAGVDQLKNLKNLKKLYLWKTKVSKEKADELKSSMPGLYVNIGWEYEQAAIARAEEAAAAPAEAEAAVKAVAGPINANCPLKPDRAASANQTVTYKGQVIGLCCANCKRRFAANPEEFISKVPEFKLENK